MTPTQVNALIRKAGLSLMGDQWTIQSAERLTKKQEATLEAHYSQIQDVLRAQLKGRKPPVRGWWEPLTALEAHNRAQEAIRAYGLILVPVGGGYRIGQSAHARLRLTTMALDDEIRPYRDEVAALLQARVQTMVTGTCVPTPADLDPWRHAEEGQARMAVAENKIMQWEAEGFVPRVRWEPSVAIVDARTGQPLEVKSWMLPEALYLLRERTPAQPPTSTSSVAPGGPGGAQRGGAA